MGVVTYVGVVVGDDGTVLVDGTGRVPRFDVASDEAGFWQDVAAANRHFSKQLGADVTVLRHLGIERIESGSVRTLLLQSHGPAVGRFVEPGRAEWPVPAVPDLERASGVPDEYRVPWFETGWYDEATAWIESILPWVEQITQVRSWNLSTVLQAAGGGGRWFFKAESPALPGEVQLTAGLADLFPRLMPTVVATDLDRKWMLLADAGTTRLDDFDEPMVWGRAGEAFAQMQIDSVGADLQAFGCPRRPPLVLAEDVGTMVADDRWLTVGEYGLDATDLAAVQSRARSWIDHLADLDSLDLPLAVEHGDFHPGQVMADDLGRTSRVLDWSDVSVSVPFISLEMFLATVNDFVGLPADAEPPAPARAFRDAYVETWGAAIDPSIVERARTLIRAALPALYGLPYWRLVPRMEQPWEMWNVLPYTMRNALADQPT